MKNLFLFALCLLICFTQVMTYRGGLGRETGQTVPVLYWVTDLNPARAEQMLLFQKWLKSRGFGDVEVKIDAANTGLQKAIVQGVTGVAGDLMGAASPNLGFLYEMGILYGVDDLEKAYGYPDAEVWPALRPEIYRTENGKEKQFGFPASFSVPALVVNASKFKSLGLTPPALVNTIEEWEALGREFTRRANAGKRRQDTFFCADLNIEAFRRASGIATFNETLTASSLNQPAMVQILLRFKKWMEQDHLLPTLGESASFASEAGYGGSTFQMLHKGYLGMAYTGRWALLQMRAMKDPMDWTASLVPHGGFPNAVCQTRAIVIYAGSKQKKWAHQFVGFLRSDEYNMHIVRDADALPPSPRFLSRPEYREPVGHTNEWPLHQAFAEIAIKYARGRDISPFILYADQAKIEEKAFHSFVSGVLPAEDAARDMESGINKEISRYLARHPNLRDAYQKACEKQRQIDTLKASGQGIPPAMIDNPFLRSLAKPKLP